MQAACSATESLSFPLPKFHPTIAHASRSHRRSLINLTIMILATYINPLILSFFTKHKHHKHTVWLEQYMTVINVGTDLADEPNDDRQPPIRPHQRAP